ncbi:MAG: MMPL family transporter [Theionarchaea archaeon]|nr:MMPL family transporter [Theionarchaea archaeon]
MNRAFKDLRVMILVFAVLVSLFAIKPSYSEGEIQTNLKFGIELAGGSFIRLALQGCMVQIDADADAILIENMEKVLNKQVTLVTSTDEVATFQCPGLTEEEQNNLTEDLNLPFTFPDENSISLERSEDGVIIWLLRRETNSEVWKVSYNGEDYIEIRAATSQEQIDDILGEHGTVTRYLDKVSPETTKETRRIIENKLNYLGLQDIKVRVWGEDYIMVDMAGKSLEEAREIVSKPGKFEIKIKMGVTPETSAPEETPAETVVPETGTPETGIPETGTPETVAPETGTPETGTPETSVPEEGVSEEPEEKAVFVVSGAEIARVDPASSPPGSTWGVPFTFTSEGAQIFAEKCIELGAADPSEDVRKVHEVAMYLDDVEVFSAPLQADLARSIREGTYRGSQVAQTGDYESARELEIHLRAGALPVKPKIVGEGETPPELGQQFLRQVIQAIIGAVVAVALIIYIRYRYPRVVLPLLACAFSETLIVLGFAAMINHQLDLPSLAGVIATLGTGVDQMVIITDEVVRGEMRRIGGLLQRVSRAFSIIFVSAATTVIAMTPLAYMQLGVLRGFAIITIAGIFIGIFITRPAYGRLVTYIIKT